MRGIRRRGDTQEAGIRITPAHAGNTLVGDSVPIIVKDHPRACGEYCTPQESSAFAPGSPPRMRGILDLIVFRRAGRRITPAHAGNTANEHRRSIRR